MGHRPDVIPLQQVIFTSIRSPMGEGYRIVAAGRGVKHEEKTEITRRAPSHASLCEDRADAVGLLAFPLAGGRYCVAHVQYAGQEHTGRGGQRVYTHCLILDQRDYRRFGCNPLLLHDRLDELIGGKPDLRPPKTLSPLSLPSPPPPRPIAALRRILSGRPVGAQPRIDESRRRRTECVLRFSQAILAGEELLVAACRDGLDMLRQTIITLPLFMRESLAISAGLEYSSARQVRICVRPANRCDPPRAARGRRLRLLDLESNADLPPSAYDPWLDLLRRWLDADREGETDRLARKITDVAAANSLNRIAHLASAIDRNTSMDDRTIARLDEQYADFDPNNQAEATLLRIWREVRRRRKSALADEPTADYGANACISHGQPSRHG